MSAPEVFQLANGPISAAAFSADRTQLAICPSTNDIQIYQRAGGEWQLKTTLSEHDKLITAISWAPHSNRLVSCSQDRNAYVWTPDATTGSWKPALVLLRINRAATCAKWSPREDKFAVGSGARTIAVCSFDEENNWWVSRHLKKPLRSTVLGIDWHPNNVLLAAGAADMKARVFSAFIKGVDSKPEPTAWGDKLPFNTVCGEFGSPSGGWVHGVAFSPSGNVLGYVSHDSTITIVYPSEPGAPPASVQTVRSPSLPYVALLFINETTLVAAGHDCAPVLFSGGPEGWALARSLDDPSAGGARAMTPTATGAGAARTGGPGRLNTEAFNRFRQADSRGTSASASVGGGAMSAGGTAPGSTSTNASGELLTVHQNTILDVQAYEWAQDGSVAKFFTVGRDGRLCIWSL